MLKKIKNMKYKFKTNYVYVYFTDDKGSQGRLTYTKGDVVQGILSADKINIKITPVKVYDIVAKKYITLSNIGVRSTFLEDVPEYQQGRPDTTVIKKYKITKDYDAPFFYQKDLIYTMEEKKPKTYYKDNIVSGTIIENKIINGNYDITAVAEPYDDKKTENEPQPEKKQSKIFTTNNILIGLAAIAIIGMGYYIIKK